MLLGTGEERLGEWVNEFNLTFPVVADLQGIGLRWEVDNARPSQTLIAPGGEIVIRDGEVTAQDIDALISQNPW